MIFAGKSITQSEAWVVSPEHTSYDKTSAAQRTPIQLKHHIYNAASIPLDANSVAIKMAHPKHFLPRSGQFEDDDQHRTLELDATPIARADRPATTTEVTDHALPPLQTHVRRKWLFGVGITVAFFDLCVMPNVYFYALKFGTKLTLQYSMFCPPKNHTLWDENKLYGSMANRDV